MAIALACADSGGRQELLVSAAASLTDAFAEISVEFEADNPGFEVLLNLAGSSALREQILGGAPVDVFASADSENMEQVVAGEAGDPLVFAHNALQIAVPRGNPAGISGLEDFGRQELLLGLCAEGVPCGDYARRALEQAGVPVAVDTNEPDVRALLTKVEVGELDGAITYVTDVVAAGDGVEGIDIAAAANVSADYLIVALDREGGSGEGATAFVDFVLSAEGGRILADHGFSPP